MIGLRRLTIGCLLFAFVIVGGIGPAAAQAPKPEGEMRWALYVTLAPAWFDPGDVVGVLTPFWVLYAMHDALVKPMPGNHLTPSLAESWTVSPDQRTYEFKLREGVKFHNGDPFTAEDVKFSFERAKGKPLHEKVKEVPWSIPHRVRFVLHEPWPDFMTFYGTFVSGAGWVVPKKYVEQVGPDGFKKHPIGLGPYKFVSHKPGIELVMEAYEGYWRKMPSVKRLVFKSVPEATTRLAMLKRGEVDLAYLLDAPQAEEVKRDPNLKLAFSGGIGTFYLDFLDSGTRSRRGAISACGWPRAWPSTARRSARPRPSAPPSRPATSCRGRFEFALPLEPHPYDPARAKKLLAEAGYPERLRRRRSASLAALYLDGRGGRQLPRRGRHQDADARPWSARPSTRRWPPRSSRGLHVRRTRCTATPPRACRRSCPARGPTPTAPIRTSRRSTASRPGRPTRRSARRCSTRSSRCSTTACASPRSTTTSGRAAWARASRTRR